MIKEVSCKIDLPYNTRIHNIFHVSRHKKVFRKKISPCDELPPLDDEGKLVLELKAILDKKKRILRNIIILEYLVKWKNLLEEDATWVGEEIITHSKLLEDKQI